LKIHAVRLRVETESGMFGFDHRFGQNLTIIRGGNSAGKSTLVNSLLFGIGMEELVGGKSEATLPYAVKDWLEHDGVKIPIKTSEVLVEMSGASESVFTFRRAIKHPQRSPKLVEIADGAILTTGGDFKAGRATYLFDAGAAQVAEGFHRFLESALGWKLPQVPATNGGNTKLYIQTLFAALAVEQKRGWTDYVANIPFFGIREARTRVVEYLLGLNVFESAARRSALDSEAVAVNYEWEAVLRQVRQLSSASGLSTPSIPTAPKADFGAASQEVRKRLDTGDVDLRAYIERLRAEHEEIEQRSSSRPGSTGSEDRTVFDRLLAEHQRLTNLYETAGASLTLHTASLSDMQVLYASTREDLSKNRTAAKLRALGAEHEFALSSGKCPTCHQEVEDSLVDVRIAGPQMDLATNISYLEKQCAMFERQIAGLTQAVRDSSELKVEITRKLSQVREQLDSSRKDLAQGTQQSRVDLRRQLQIEGEVKQLEEAETLLVSLFVELQKLAARLAANQDARKHLPSAGYSAEDELRIDIFEKNFRANASAFEYESADVADIEINRHALLPVLTRVRSKTDIKADSSASDFVRLIWSYLLALYQTSSSPSSRGNHPGFLLFDEPGQHSMAATSQHALMQHLSGERGLQSIVAASFDESDVVFREATEGVDFKLIHLEGKAIQKLA
jgi:hypothetical protein